MLGQHPGDVAPALELDDCQFRGVFIGNRIAQRAPAEFNAGVPQDRFHLSANGIRHRCRRLMLKAGINKDRNYDRFRLRAHRQTNRQRQPQDTCTHETNLII